MSVAEDLKKLTPAEATALTKDAVKSRERMRREVARELDAEEYRTVGELEVLTLRERLKRPRPPIQYRINRLVRSRFCGGTVRPPVRTGSAALRLDFLA